MAQDVDVNYASVVFRSDKPSPSRAKTEDKTLYGEVRVENGHRVDILDEQSNSERQGTEDDSARLVTEHTARKRHRHCQLLAYCALLLCFTLLLAAVAVFLYHSKVTFLESEKENLTSERRNLTAQNQQLSEQVVALESKMKNLTKEMENAQAELNDVNKLNVSRAQWIVDSYCPREADGPNRTCNACENGWLYFESRCYLINKADKGNLKTWEVARRECSGKNSQLAVVENATEMHYIQNNSYGSEGTFGYWLGLKVQGGRWKWLDGSEPTQEQSSWMPQGPARNGSCAISVTDAGLKAVKCTKGQRWICKKLALEL